MSGEYITLDGVLYCQRDHIYIGYGADTQLTPPEDHEDDHDWLADHCWICGRSRSQITYEEAT